MQKCTANKKHHLPFRGKKSRQIFLPLLQISLFSCLEMTLPIRLGPFRPLPRHFPRKISNLYHVPVLPHLRLAHLCMCPETVLHSMALNLTWMALSREQVFCQKRPCERCRRCLCHPWPSGDAGRGSTPGALPESCLRPDSADSPTPLRWVRLQENPRTKRLCDSCFESGL